MTGAAGDSPDTAGTDPLVAVVAEVLRPYRLGGTSVADEIVAAVRAHQNTAGRQAAAQALRDAADAWDPDGLYDIRDWLRDRAATLDPS